MEPKVITFCHSDLPRASFAAFEGMRNRGELCDLTIAVRNRSFPAHRVIVAAAIPYFRSAFMSSGDEKEKEIAVVDMDPIALESLIDYAYSSKINISGDNVHSLLLASKFLQMKQVWEACVDFLKTSLRVENVEHVRGLAFNLKILSLTESCNRFIRKNFEDFLKTGDFLSFSYPCIKEIISEDDLNVSGEEIVFEAILQWTRHAPSERLDMFPELLREVRLVYLPRDYLIKRVESEKLIKTSIPCRDLINDVKNYHLLPEDKSMFPYLKTEPRRIIDGTHDIFAVCHGRISGVSVYRCDCVNEKWTKLASQKEPNDFVYHVAAVNEKIYMFHEKGIQTFHLKTQEWEALGYWHESILGAAIVSYQNRIYCFGSCKAEFLDKVRCFDTLQNKWMKEGKMTRGRYDSAASSLGKSIYVMGGSYRIQGLINAVEEFSPSTGQWSEIASMLTPRCCHACTTLNGRIYACGGWIPHNRFSQTVEVYDPVIDQWSSISSNRIGRECFSLLSHKSKIYAFGGESDKSSCSFEIYDPESDEWKTWFRLPEGFRRAVLLPTDHV